jgi:sugar phosphate permease
VSLVEGGRDALRAGWYAVAVLWLGYICSFVDRQVLALLVEPIKATLALERYAGVSLLQGLAFGLFYALMGLPCGMLIDRYSRRVVIACGIAVWSLATIACGFAGGFWSPVRRRACWWASARRRSRPARCRCSRIISRARSACCAISIYVSAGSVGGGLAMVAGGAAIAWADGASVPPARGHSARGLARHLRAGRAARAR